LRSGSGTVLVATANQAKVEIRAKAEIGQLTDLGSVDAGLSVSRYKDVGVKMVTRTNLTPLFRAVRLRRSVWDIIFRREGDFEYALRAPNTFDLEDMVNVEPNLTALCHKAQPSI
jgi:hypothetical protein